jgi:hypothetical protein
METFGAICPKVEPVVAIAKPHYCPKYISNWLRWVIKAINVCGQQHRYS